MPKWNLKERVKICKIQISAQRFYAYPTLSRIGVYVKNEDGTGQYENHKPNTDWDAELIKCNVSA